MWFGCLLAGQYSYRQSITDWNPSGNVLLISMPISKLERDNTHGYDNPVSSITRLRFNRSTMVCRVGRDKLSNVFRVL